MHLLLHIRISAYAAITPHCKRSLRSFNATLSLWVCLVFALSWFWLGDSSGGEFVRKDGEYVDCYATITMYEYASERLPTSMPNLINDVGTHNVTYVPAKLHTRHG